MSRPECSTLQKQPSRTQKVVTRLPDRIYYAELLLLVDTHDLPMKLLLAIHRRYYHPSPRYSAYRVVVGIPPYQHKSHSVAPNSLRTAARPHNSRENKLLASRNFSVLHLEFTNSREGKKKTGRRGPGRVQMNKTYNPFISSASKLYVHEHCKLTYRVRRQTSLAEK